MRWTTRFLLSAMSDKQFPAPSVPEVAFLGRSNVGKSSLINALLGSVQAKVSQTPGRTRAINFFALQPGENKPPAMLFADLPGYGYAKISKSISAEWPTFIEPYLEDRETLALCVCLVDSNIPVQESDIQLQATLRRWGRSVVVVATKADRHSNNTLKNALRELQQGLEVEHIVPCSANKKTGMKELWAAILAGTGVSG